MHCQWETNEETMDNRLATYRCFLPVFLQTDSWRLGSLKIFKDELVWTSQWWFNPWIVDKWQTSLNKNVDATIQKKGHMLIQVQMIDCVMRYWGLNKWIVEVFENGRYPCRCPFNWLVKIMHVGCNGVQYVQTCSDMFRQTPYLTPNRWEFSIKMLV